VAHAAAAIEHQSHSQWLVVHQKARDRLLYFVLEYLKVLPVEAGHRTVFPIDDAHWNQYKVLVRSKIRAGSGMPARGPRPRLDRDLGEENCRYTEEEKKTRGL
jgi:hypothetical protein